MVNEGMWHESEITNIQNNVLSIVDRIIVIGFRFSRCDLFRTAHYLVCGFAI
jgi:hypothetical protein